MLEFWGGLGLGIGVGVTLSLCIILWLNSDRSKP